MAQEAVALIGLALLVSLTQWLVAAAVTHLGIPDLPGRAGARVRRRAELSPHVHLTCAATVLVVLGVQAVVLAG